MERIAVMTSGGDAPGMNACIRAVVRSAIYYGFKVFGVRRGYAGLIGGEIIPMELRSVSGIINLGGTILKTARCEEFRTKEGREKAIKVIKDNNIEGLVVIGGDGSFTAAGQLYEQYKIPIVGIPVTIDNDVCGTDYTVGFDTAINTALEAIDKIRDTAFSHERIFIIEVMGRKRGFLALEVGLASGSEIVLLPEVKYDLDVICESILHNREKGKTSYIIIMAEGAGNSFAIADQIKKCTGFEVKVSIIGYIQRGGSPTARSRKIASLFGIHAVQVLKDMQESSNPKIVGIREEKIIDYDLEYMLKNEKKIDRELYELAQILAI